MSPDLMAAVAFAAAALATYAATPAAIALAVRTSFFDHPSGYKGHARATPYLGGLALMVGVLAGALAVPSVLHHYGLLVGCAVGMSVVGTLDDRVNLPVLARLAAEVLIGGLLWSSGHGWTTFHDGAANLVLTIFWVVGVVNAFNLMDNTDGAAATTAAVSAIGAGVLALISDVDALAPLCFAVAGACLSFLPRNLAGPARIFMGDGGSLPIGLLVAGVAMDSVSRRYLGPSGVVVGALLVALVVLDTTLVTISRTRARRSLLSGGRDHLTHRLSRRLGSPRPVALTLAITQLIVSGITIAVAEAGVGWVFLTGAVGVALGAVLIWQFEGAAWLEDGPASDIAVDPAALEPAEPVGRAALSASR